MERRTDGYKKIIYSGQARCELFRKRTQKTLLRGRQLSHLEQLGSKRSIAIKPDADGYLGRECPNAECEGYFKVRTGTGNSQNRTCYCPYCGKRGDPNDFATKDQLEYAKSVVMREVKEALFKDLRKMERHTSGGFINFSVKVEGGPPIPLHHYREKALETQVICEACKLDYMVYGVFVYCPDCGEKNTFQALQANHEVILEILDLAAQNEKATVRTQLIEDALENCVSGFDAYGRKTLGLAGKRVISFQNLLGARKTLRDQHAFDVADGVEPDTWDFVVRCFQKRHLFSHSMGVIDDEYMKKANDPAAVIGRKVSIDADEVRQLIPVLQQFAKNLQKLP